MSVQSSFDNGFFAGFEAVSEKIAADYGLEKTAVIADLARRAGILPAIEPEPEPGGALSAGGLSGQQLGAGAAGAAGLMGLGAGTNFLGNSLAGNEQAIADALKNRATGASNINIYQQMLQDSLPEFKAQGGDVARRQLQALDTMDKSQLKSIMNELGDDALAAAKRTRVPGEKIQGSSARDLIRRALEAKSESAGFRAVDEAAAGIKANKSFIKENTKALQQARNSNMGRLGKYVNANTLKNVGKGVAGIGGLGGLALLGNEAYQAFRD